MVDVFREQLPASYLLVLMDTAAPGPETTLEQALHRATRSDKPAVWVDCSLCPHPSPEVVALLLAYHAALRSTGRPLVLAHVSEEVRAQLSGPPAASPTILPTLLDADRPAYVSAA